jgi:hypothetical protein
MSTRDDPTGAEPVATEPSDAARIGRYVGPTIAAVVVAFFLVRLLGAPWPAFPPSYPDSFSYLKVAGHGPLTGHFYFDERPIGYPLLLWLVGRSSTLVVVAQTALYVASFWILCHVVAVELRSRVVAVITVVFLVALAIEPRNSMWNTIMLSESLSTSVAVLSIAAWWRAGARPSKQTVLWAWIATAAWILVRDTNVLPTVLVILPAVVAFAWATPKVDRAVRRRLYVGALAILALCGYVYIAQAVTHRTQYSVHNSVGIRVLPNTALTRWFVAGGMPLDETLRGRTNHSAWDDGDKSFLDDPALARYREWARGPGGRRLLLAMGLQGRYFWNQLHHELPNILHDDNQMYDTYGVFGRFPHHFPPPLGTPRTPAGLWAEMLLATGGIVIALIEGRRRVLAVVALVGLLSALLDIWTSYAGDPLEVNRHLVGPLARLNVFVILAIALGADAVIARPHSPSPAPDDEQPDDTGADAEAAPGAHTNA